MYTEQSVKVSGQTETEESPALRDIDCFIHDYSYCIAENIGGHLTWRFSTKAGIQKILVKFKFGGWLSQCRGTIAEKYWQILVWQFLRPPPNH